MYRIRPALKPRTALWREFDDKGLCSLSESSAGRVRPIPQKSFLRALTRMRSSPDRLHNGGIQATRSAEEMMTLCIKTGAVDTLLLILQKGCSDCASAAASHGPLALTYAAQCLLKMAPVEECKALLIARGGTALRPLRPALGVTHTWLG